MSRPSLFFFALLIFSSSAMAEKINKKFAYNEERNKFHISSSLLFHTSSINSEDSNTSIASEADFSVIAQSVSAQYFINEKFAFSGSYYFALVIDIDAELQGFDLGIEYFPMSNGASKSIEILGSTINTTPEWAPYLYLGASTRNVQFSTVNLKFQGVQGKAGTYWHFGDNKLFIKGEGFFEKLFNNNVREITSFGASVGFGRTF